MSNSIKFIVFTLLVLISSSVLAAFNKNLWPVWEVNNPLSTATISHDEWQKFLDVHVRTNQEGINLVDYPNLTSKDKTRLKNYIDRMATINVSEYNRNEQLAYWLNLYNAITVQTIANYYPVNSVEEINISPGLFSIGPWGAKLITVNKLSLSLEEIENRIIRPIWNDPRIHYALNNGAIGAPNLRKQAFTGPSLNQQLNEAAFEYINSKRGVQIIDKQLVVSRLYDWYNEDFGETPQNILIHLKQFAHEPLKTQLGYVSSIENYIYNWHLNATVAKQ